MRNNSCSRPRLMDQLNHNQAHLFHPPLKDLPTSANGSQRPLPTLLVLPKWATLLPTSTLVPFPLFLTLNLPNPNGQHSVELSI
jgi:hypothetical protein